MKLYTIGHSNHPISNFIKLLDENGVALLVDVRSAPYSRYNPQFNKEELKQKLDKHFIEYAYAGQYLGGRPQDPTCYKHNVLPNEGTDYLHEVNYPEVMKRQWFIQGIQRLLELTDQQTTTIMCSEEDPAQCHRHHLIAKYLLAKNPEVMICHIRGDGLIINAKTILTSVDKADAEQLSFSTLE